MINTNQHILHVLNEMDRTVSYQILWENRRVTWQRETVKVSDWYLEITIIGTERQHHYTLKDTQNPADVYMTKSREDVESQIVYLH